MKQVNGRRPCHPQPDADFDKDKKTEYLNIVYCRSVALPRTDSNNPNALYYYSNTDVGGRSRKSLF